MVLFEYSLVHRLNIPHICIAFLGNNRQSREQRSECLDRNLKSEFIAFRRKTGRNQKGRTVLASALFWDSRALRSLSSVALSSARVRLLYYQEL